MTVYIPGVNTEIFFIGLVLLFIVPPLGAGLMVLSLLPGAGRRDYK